ncbi:uncharacterized protein PV09_05458 [Verruconis gallopava]|uniref:Serine-threonine protein kinase 19 n=1 Tax=Verruconis gallopava TaxID=253628 RepID=A0A0D1XLD9_9PEZI|nr:uncharacterized protein PV09_05458 [Verruconis gallopava]KIW03236.1 hypothetical protein PV09_05458 [Verruconis gallopava]
MPLQLTAAASRVQKSPAKRASSSPFSSSRKKRQPASTEASKRPKPTPEEDDEAFDLKLDDIGLVASLANDLNLSDVAQLVRWISEHQWCPIPEAGAGMNSTRIAEVLNYRRRLPPLVSVHHVYALSKYPTSTEREIGALVNGGIIRRITLPPRETGGSSLGEALVLVDEWESLVRQRSDLEHGIKEKYVTLLRDPAADVDFTQQEIATLAHAGFLIGSDYLKGKADNYLRPGESTLGDLQSVSAAGLRHASGSVGAVAESGKQHIAGGSGFTTRVASSSRSSAGSRVERAYKFTLPNIGSYLKLLHESRAHLLQLLVKGNRYREMPRDLLRERWDGGIAGNDEATKAQRMRGEWLGVSPGKTRKWKQFCGLDFQWVLEECLGAGLVECFNTRSVGLGVRAL